MNNFFLTLPSNSSMNIHLNNTAASFKTVLPKHVSVKGDYEVALMELHYPCTLHNMSEEKQFIRYIDNLTRQISLIRIPDGTYTSIEFLLQHLNSTQINGKIIFQFDVLPKQYIHFKCSSKQFGINFSPSLALQLGFHPDMDFLSEAKAQSPFNLVLGVPKSLYVYTDIVSPQLVGDVMARLLRVVCVDLKNYTYGGQGSETFTVPQYVPVSKQEIQEIEININDDSGNVAPFLAGTSTLVLHFRKR